METKKAREFWRKVSLSMKQYKTNYEKKKEIRKEKYIFVFYGFTF